MLTRILALYVVFMAVDKSVSLEVIYVISLMASPNSFRPVKLTEGPYSFKWYTPIPSLGCVIYDTSVQSPSVQLKQSACFVQPPLHHIPLMGCW
jgi:hypothetical protein